MKTISNFTEWYEDKELIENYIKNSPKINKINWFDLPENTQFLLKEFPNKIKQLGKSNFVSLQRLKKTCGKDSKLNDLIIGIKKMMIGNSFLKVQFPLNLKTEDYIKLYSLMISEGYTDPEFSIHVPEKYFHIMLHTTIKNLISLDFANEIRSSRSKGVLKSSAPAKTRHLVPTPKHLPFMILENKEFAREYLRVAFDAEGSALLDKMRHKRYIKLSRYVNITNFVNDEQIPLQQRIYINNIKYNYPQLFEKIKQYPPKTLLGEHILLKKHFDIDSKLQLEAIRKNKTHFRAGKITARWVLFIYAENVPKFIKEINFISDEKRKKCRDMLKLRTNQSQYTALKLMKKLSKDNVFLSKDFICVMKKKGYISPFKYIWSYKKKGLIEKIKRGKYKIIC